MQTPSWNELAAALCRYVKARYFPGRARTPDFTPADLHFFAPSVASVSAAFTSERAALPRNYFNRKEFRSGYLLYFVVSNVPKVWHCLDEIGAASRFRDRASVRILDVGSGPGTGLLGATAYWAARAPAQALHCLAIDQNREILADARVLLADRQRPTVTVQTRALDLGWRNLAEALHRERFDIILAMNVLNEFGDLPTRHRLINALLHHHLAPDGVLILIEPGLQRTTRDLMALRDLLVTPAHRDIGTSNTIRILAPCLHTDACPMRRQNGRDWCHFYLDWERPQIIADLDRLIGNKKEYLKFSYVILGTHPALPEDNLRTHALTHSRTAPCFRVVSAPLRSKGKTELLLCPSAGAETGRLHRLVRLDRDRTPENAAFDRVWRGDVVTCPDTHLAGTSALRIIRPFS